MTVITIGEVVVDWLSTEPGESMRTASRFYRALGGNATNTAIGLSRLGDKVRLIGKIGDDLHGHFLLDKLKGEGVDLTYLRVDGSFPTAQCYMTTDERGEHQFFNWPKPHAADMLRPEEVPAEAFEGVRFLHATGISLLKDPRKSAVQKALSLCRQMGAIISFDASFPSGSGEQARAELESVFSSVHILKFNLPELLFWAGGTPGDEVELLARRLLRRFSPAAVVVTLSAEGSIILTENSMVTCPPVAVASVCEVGAGDAYVAGLLHYLLRILEPDHSIAYLSRLSPQQWQSAGMAGNVAGAMVTRAVSAYETFPLQSEFDEVMGKTSITSPS